MFILNKKNYNKKAASDKSEAAFNDLCNMFT